MHPKEAVTFVRVTFEVIRPITGLEFYHGIYWSAMLRDWLRPYSSQPLAELGVYPIPLNNAIMEYEKGDLIALDLAIHQGALLWVMHMLSDTAAGKCPAHFPNTHIHFHPGVSISLRSYKIINELPLHSTHPDIIAESHSLSDYPELTLVFHAPLRLKPVSEAKTGYRFLDPLGVDDSTFFHSLLKDINPDQADFQIPHIIHKGLIWVDVHYEKTLGGMMGAIKISNPENEELMCQLVWGQYCGIGKNRSFGFGFYYIAESPGFRAALPDQNLISLLKRGATLRNISAALEGLKSSSPGIDNLAKEDLLAAGKPYLLNAQRQIIKGSLPPGETLRFRKRSHNGSYRVISIASIGERHLLLCILRQISHSLDRLVSPDCYSYREGRDYHQAAKTLYHSFRAGFSMAIKADIASFFDSIPHEPLKLLLHGLFYHDNIKNLICSNLLCGQTGIPQGNPISPLLSNLCLIPFDREIKQRGWKLIRYADDFCVLADKEHEQELGFESISSILNGLGFVISKDKCLAFSPTQSIDYCGYRVDVNTLEKLKQKIPDDFANTGIPAFQEDIAKGRPLYLTFKDSYAKIDCNSIMIQRDAEIKQYSIKEISRIVIIGKPRVSAGLIQQAIIRGKPISFLSVMGKPLGGFAQHTRLHDPQGIFNPVSKDWPSFCLDYIRSIVAAKIHNQRAVLKQNNIDEPRLKELEFSLPTCVEDSSLRGKEGVASQIYWSHYRKLVAPLDFPRRAYHPPEGPVNSLLSIGYSIIYYRLAECLMASGINPYSGIFHQPRGAHMALASDMIEPFRFLVDRIVLSLIHNRQITTDDFISGYHPSYQRLAPQAMKKYIHRFEYTMRNEVKAGNELTTWALLMDASAGRLLRSLRLGIDFNPNRLS